MDHEKVKKLFGARLKSIRETRRLTQEQLAERVDMNPVYLSNIERGKENPTLNILIRISIALYAELSDLFEFNHEASSKVLRDMLKKLTSEIDDKDKLKIALRVVRAIVT